jgi:eukaryotic-like serine/threonine-protein kinase
MTPERYHLVKQLLASVIEQEPQQRAAFLAQTCAEDEELRREVESLLAHQEPSADFIEESAFDVSARVLADEAAAPMLGRRIGPYRIVRQLGVGGMGAVYLAERDDAQYRKTVAVKLIKREMLTGDTLRRFHNERQILANLEHPNIARLVDGGTTDDGIPYLVMEYIEGLPIVDYCEARQLALEERLKLFRTVCAAVHFAHQNLVIHRDLKPSNILVDAQGVPKLLDFGIAKLLQPVQGDDRTATAFRALTPAYASPEQIRGEPITTASDVYSLGVLLYQLLTGQRPFSEKGRAPYEVAQAICETQPERPSQAVVERMTDEGRKLKTTSAPHPSSFIPHPSKLRGDLDNIVLMALRKDPLRRYASVEQFSEDIRRHLEALPVRARKDTFSYRAAKFVTRNKLGVAAACFIFVALLVAVVIVSQQAHAARVQRARAERRFNDVRQLANSFMFEVHDSIKDLSGATSARALLVQKALTYLDSLAREAGDDRSLQHELAIAYIKVADIQGQPFGPNLGDTDGALASYRKAQEILKALLAAEPLNIAARRYLGQTHTYIGRILGVRGNYDGNLASQLEAVAAFEALMSADPANRRYRFEAARAYGRLAEARLLSARAVRSVEQCQQALESYRRSIALLEELSSAEPANAEFRNSLAGSYNLINYALFSLGSWTGEHNYYRTALDYVSKAQQACAQLAAAEPLNANYRRNLADLKLSAGDLYVGLGDFSAALATFRQALHDFQQLAQADPANQELRVDIAIAHKSIATALAKSGDLEGALAENHRWLRIYQELHRADPSRYSPELPEIYEAIGDLLFRLDNRAGALENYRRALTYLEAFSVEGRLGIKVRRALALDYERVGRVHASLALNAKALASTRVEACREAQQWYQRSLAVWQKLREEGHLNAEDASKVTEVSNAVAACDGILSER